MARHISRATVELLGGLATSDDGERLSILHTVERNLGKAGQCWLDLVGALSASMHVEAPEGRKMPDERAVILYLADHPAVPPDERRFLASLKRKVAHGLSVTAAEWSRLRSTWCIFEGVSYP